MSRILLVEDSQIFGAIVKKTLEKQLQRNIIWAKTFATAKQIIDDQKEPFEIALLDLNLPDAETGEVVDYAIAKGIPAIVFTSRFDIELHKQIWGKGVVDYVMKDGPDSLNYIAKQVIRLERNPRYKILVVDDSSVIRRLISKLLQIHHFQVITAENGIQALSMLEQHPDIKLVLTDYNMPEMDGFELTRKLRRKHSQTNLVIIGLSTQGDQYTAAKFIKHGANDFISKPFHAEEFYCRINLNVDTLENIRLIRESSYRDYLTGLHNRRYFFEHAPALHQQEKALCVAMLDIDFFKKVNDQYGHDVGDITLKYISAALQNALPEAKLIARFGGEEFCVVLQGVEPAEAQQCFELARKDIENTAIPLADGSFNVTISIGLCTDKGSSIEEMINLADEQLYRAKEQGRNCVCTTLETNQVI
ncbi:MAG: diguanylate cyclase [Desulfuromonadales bacterium]|nr:diguanylate cyclase [Desulfuromonadales bacterium]